MSRFLFKFFCAFFFLFQNIEDVCSQQHVVFGERNLSDSLPHIYLDRWGHIYPNHFIPDSLLIQSNGNLHQFYQNYPEFFIQIIRKEQLFDSLPTVQNITKLEEKLIQNYQQKWNILTDKSVLFAVHGYRKSFHRTTTDISSPDDFYVLHQKINEINPKEHHWIEIYWDGGYDCCFSLNTKKNQALFQLFEVVYKQSELVGEKLQTILSRVNHPKQGFIAHSLGVKVLAPIMQISSQNTRSFFILAPAIDADSSWKNWQKNNQNLIWIIWNKHDFALQKKDSKTGLFGPGVKRFGNTSLGCNKNNALAKWQEKAHLAAPKLTIFSCDVSSCGKIHSQRYYINNPVVKDALAAFLYSVF